MPSTMVPPHSNTLMTSRTTLTVMLSESHSHIPLPRMSRKVAVFASSTSSLVALASIWRLKKLNPHLLNLVLTGRRFQPLMELKLILSHRWVTKSLHLFLLVGVASGTLPLSCVTQTTKQLCVTGSCPLKLANTTRIIDLKVLWPLSLLPSMTSTVDPGNGKTPLSKAPPPSSPVPPSELPISSPSEFESDWLPSTVFKAY